MTNLSQKLQNLRQDVLNGWREFLDHPKEYSGRALVNLVKDYWDLIPAAVGGLAISDQGGKIFGDYQRVAMSGLLISILYDPIREFIEDPPGFLDYFKGKETTRDFTGHTASRNMFAAAAAFLIATDYGREDPFGKEIAYKFVEALSIATSTASEYMRRYRFPIPKHSNNSQMTLEQSL